MTLLRNKGASYQAIGSLFGISRARVHQIISGYKPLEIREIILERDNYKCQWHKKIFPYRHNTAKKKDLVVHHKDFDDRNNNPENLITVCRKCHGSYHGKHSYDVRDGLDPLMVGYTPKVNGC